MDYSKFAQVASRILIDFGFGATLTRKSSAYNPSTSVATVTPATVDVTVALFPYPADLIDGTIIHSGDVQVFMSAVGLAEPPQATDKLTVAGVSYTVIGVKNYKPTDTSVLYELQVRK